MLTRKGRSDRTVPVKIDFGEGQELNIEVRKVARSYGNIKQLMAVSKEVARNASQAADLKKQAESLEGAAKTAMEAQAIEIEGESSRSVEVLIDWIAGAEGQLAAIAKWDFFEDDSHSQTVEISRARIEEFEPAEIATIAATILQSLSPPEATAER